MAKFNMDFSGAKEFVMCGKGEHDFKVTSAELKSYNKDNETRQKIELTCEVFGGEDSGAKVFYSIFLKNPTGLYMFLTKIGVKIEKRAYSDMDTNMFIGKCFTADVEHENYSKNDGSNGVKAKIIETSVRKYINTNTNENMPDGLSDDAFADFGDSIEISNDDIAF